MHHPDRVRMVTGYIEWGFRSCNFQQNRIALQPFLEFMYLSASEIATAYSVISIYALSIYDFLLLLDDECRLVYKSNWSIIKTIYVTSRFMTLVSWPMIIFIIVTNHEGDACSIWICVQSMIYFILQNLPHCLLLMCTWAFSGKKKLLAWLFSTALLAYFTASMLQDTALLVLYGAIGIDITAAAVVIYHYVRDPHIRGDLGKLCFMQAVMYIFIMLMINLSTTYTDVFKPATTSMTHPMTMVLPNLLACRFILQLRRKVNPTATQLSERLSIIVHEGIENSEGNEGM
ncbi:hypothetical protein APHAL10511_008157 [Amanita phalloides]|nr:hypothetical protein APHAL10511_008157 [Amanita phalloides]